MIALFIPNIKPVCGRTRIVISLAEEFERQRISYIIITNKESETSLTNHLKCDFIIIPCNPDKKNIYSFIKSLYLLRSAVIRNKIKILNSHHRYCEFISLASRTLLYYNVNIVTTVHSFTTDKRIISYRSDHLITVSNYIRNHLVDFYKIDGVKITTIYNGVFVKDQIVSSGDSNNIVLGFGRFEEAKGFDILIKAISRLKNKGDYQLKLIGAGKHKAELIRLTENLDVNTHFLESYSTPWNEISMADLIIIPSRIETFGLSIIEAGILSKCVIASNTGAIPEILEDGITGFLYSTENYEMLTFLIEKLMNDKLLREKIGAQLKKSVEQKFSSTIMANNYEKLFNRILN